MPPIEQNGPDFKYVVTWQLANDTSNGGQRGPLNTANIQRADAWHYVVPDNMPTYKAYLITVKASNAKGDSSADLNTIVGYSGEAGEGIRCCSGCIVALFLSCWSGSFFVHKEIEVLC